MTAILPCSLVSYNSQDASLASRLESALRRKDPKASIFFAPKSLRVGGYWLPELSKEITETSAFILVIGEKGVGAWQMMEYYEAFDRRVREPGFPIIAVLLKGQSVVGLPFLKQLHLIVTDNPAAEDTVARIMEAIAGGELRPGKLWRYTAPYRGLAAMTEANSAFFWAIEGNGCSDQRSRQNRR
jgi:hypothetical protein